MAGVGLAIGASCWAVWNDQAMRIRDRGTIAGSALVLALVAGGCGDSAEREELAPDAAAVVRDAALMTLDAGPANIRIRVSSTTAEYSVRGAMEVATDRFRVRARVARAPMTHFDPVVDVVGVGRETYEIGRGRPGFDNIGSACWFDLHQPIGSLGGAASVQEAVALAGIVVRLLRDGIRMATLIEQHTDGATTYRVEVEPSVASVAPTARGGDETIAVGPRRLARHLAPIRVRVGSEGLLGRLSMKLQGFRPPSNGPGRMRERRRERVSISVSLSDFGRALRVPAPPCVAME